MGQLITTVVGGAIGFALGGPLGASIGMSIGGMIGGMLFAPTIEGPRLNDLKVTASTYGMAIPEVYGTMRVGANMIWTTGIKETKHTSRAGKGGPKQTSYTYDSSFALAICKGEIDEVLRIWADGKLIYDASANASRTRSASAPGVHIVTASADVVKAVLGKGKKTKFTMRLYRGTETQLPDGLIEADKGAGNVSAHRGLAYAVFENFQLADFGNRVPQITMEITRIVGNNIPAILATDSSGPIVNGSAIIDWELDRMYRSNPTIGGTDVIDMSTMSVMYNLPNISSIGAGSRNNYVPGAAIALTEIGVGNSRPWLVYDMLGGGFLGQYGNEAPGVAGVLSGYDYGYESYTFGGLGQLGYGYVTSPTGGRDVIMLGVSVFGYVVAFKPMVFPPIFQTSSVGNTNYFIPGRDDGVNAEIIGFRAESGGVRFQIWHIPADAKGKLENIDTIPPGPLHFIGAKFTVTTPFLDPFGGDFIPTSVLYDPTDDTIFCLGVTDNKCGAFKWSPRTTAFKWKAIYPTVFPPGGMPQSRIAGGTFAWYTGAARGWKVIDLQTGESREIPYNRGAMGDGVYIGTVAWDDVTGSAIVTGEGGYRYRVYLRSGGTATSVRQVVSDICKKSQILTDTDIDVSGLTDDPVFGYLIDKETTARDVFKQLGTAYLFDGYESDYKLKFRSRGSASSVTIPQSWIGRTSDGNFLKETLTQEIEMTMRVSVKYYDCSADYGQGVQSAKRNSSPLPTMLTAKEDSVELPLAWYPVDAKKCADKLLKTQWATRTAYEFTLPLRFLKYDPSDVITVNKDDGTTYFMRLNEMTIGADFTIAVKASSEKSSAYVSAAEPSGPQGTPAQVIGGDYPVRPLVANTPLLRDTDYDASNNAMIYITTAAIGSGHDGAYVYQSATGLEYTSLGFISGDTVQGVCMTALPFTDAYESTDEVTTLRVRLLDPTATLESVTQAEMVDGLLNAALVGNEVIQFRDAAHQTDGSWLLSGLLRARRGTNYAVRGHVAGEAFVLLDTSHFITTTRPPSEYTTSRSYRAVSPAGSLTDAYAYAYSLTPRDLQPYSPTSLKLIDDGTTCTLTGERRSRITNELTDYTGYIHYKEGERLTAKMSYAIWWGMTAADYATLNTPPDVTGTVPLFDSTSGDDIPISITFPLAGETQALVKMYEVGVVDGIPKWVSFQRASGGVAWDHTEVY